MKLGPCYRRLPGSEGRNGAWRGEAGGAACAEEAEDKVIMPMGDGRVGGDKEQLHAHTSETAENKSKTRPDKSARVPSALHFRGGRRHRPR